MTKHELAQSIWAAIQRELVERDLLRPANMEPEKRAGLTVVAVARIDGVLRAAGQAERDDDEDVICLVDNTKMVLWKPDIEGRITIDSSSFVKGDGHLVLRPGREMVVRLKEGKNSVTTRAVDR